MLNADPFTPERARANHLTQSARVAAAARGVDNAEFDGANGKYEEAIDHYRNAWGLPT